MSSERLYRGDALLIELREYTHGAIEYHWTSISIIYGFNVSTHAKSDAIHDIQYHRRSQDVHSAFSIQEIQELVA
jgi:hypothetical protein